MEGLAPKVRVMGPWAAPGLARPSWCCTRAMAAMALTTAAPMSCSRMSSHCVVAQEANWHRWFSSRSRWFSSSNLGEAEKPHHCCRPHPSPAPFLEAGLPTSCSALLPDLHTSRVFSPRCLYPRGTGSFTSNPARYAPPLPPPDP